MTNIRNAGLYATLMGMMMTSTYRGSGEKTFNGKSIKGSLQLPEDFTGYFFVKETGELIDDKWSKAKITLLGKENIFKVMSRSEENARKVFERKTKFKKRTAEKKTKVKAVVAPNSRDVNSKADAEDKVTSMIIQLAQRKGARGKKKLQKQINQFADQRGIVLK